ncbi:hypothetical protein WIS52_11605 [Pseudonocardia nematodicida]|uniref:Biotin-protein ligase N-terminal domain-containing protein n=1 Tax=Pseudonocardia nematodicida TaxID=1206997 RepID=A0ABV1KCP9_9PSEU
MPVAPDGRPVAVVFADAWTRPSESDHTDDTESVAALLRAGRHGFDVRTAGPAGERSLRDALADPSTVLFAYPGADGDDETAFRRLRRDRGAIRRFVRGGGRYLGVCMGAFLAERGFLDLLDGRVEEYWSRKGATVTTPDPSLVTVSWRGRDRTLYFQDGGAIVLPRRTRRDAEVLATYPDGPAAAVVTSFGDGAIGLVGPHPDAPRSWFDDHGLDHPGDADDLGQDLLDTLMARR